MSFGHGSNPPWQRNSSQGIPSLTNPMNLGHTNTMVGFGGSGNQSLFGMPGQQQGNMSMIPPLTGMNSNQMFNQTVSYPPTTPRGSYSSGGGGGGGNDQHHSNANQNNMTCNKIGTVTKIQNDFGFIDEEVFFHKKSCTGTLPKVGDRVLVEAAYSNNSAFKWNASRVQVVNTSNQQSNMSSNRNQSSNSQRSGSGYNAVPPPSSGGYAGGFERPSGGGRGGRNSPIRRLSPGDSRHSRSHDVRLREEEEERRRRREEREKEKEKDRLKEKIRDRSIEKRDHSPIRRSSPKRARRARVVPRYMVQVPKVTLNLNNSDLLELRHRYANLYIPSDFFTTQIRWPESFPPNAPFSLQKPCAFHICHRSVESVTENNVILDPPDADYLFSAKVMLMGIPPISEVYRKCFSTAEDKEQQESDRSYVHPSRLINFLVGLRGKNEAMAIGGPWSPSLDGPNPESDPSVLIKTAIRTCKGLTGIDLTPCTQWYRFVELYYRRSKKKGPGFPTRVETVVIYLPDVRSCVPTRIEWDALHASYKAKMEFVIKQESEGRDSISNGNDTSLLAVAKSQATASSVDGDGGGVKGNNDEAVGGNKKLPVEKGVAAKNECNEGSSATAAAAAAAAAVSSNEKEGNVVKREPTNYADLDPKTMKIVDLRDELEARNLSSKGLKPQLIARLAKILKTEESDATAAAAMDQDKNDDEEDDDGEEKSNQSAAADTTVTENEPEPSEEQLKAIDEFDMTDIVVIDEYDSTKPKVNKVCPDAPKPMEERERRLIEKRYQLPENPELIVHPSRTAKGGKFFCNEMSLSILLDYRPEDSKEHSFEVSLFAELFNEMLMRDFGFNIYKTLYNLPDKEEEKDVIVDGKKDAAPSSSNENDDDKKKTDENEEKSTTTTKDEAKKDDMEVSVDNVDESINEEKKEKDDDEEKTTEKSTGGSVNDEKTKDKTVANTSMEDKDNANSRKSSVTKDKERPDKDRRKRRGEETDDDTYSTRSGDPKRKDKERPKYITVDPELLLSFVYFDQTHCGYIFEKDIEDLFYTLGLSLSRAQARKLVSKVVIRDSLFYRKLTDKPKDEKSLENTAIASENNGLEDEKNSSEIFAKIAKGNRALLPVFKPFSVEGAESDGTKPAKRARTNTDNETNENGQLTETGMISFKGALIDIEKLLDQLKRSEKARDDTEQLLVDLRRSNTDLQSNNERSSKKIKDLQSDIKSYSRKLNDLEQTFNSVNKKCSDYHSILSSVHDRIAPIFAKSERNSSKSDSSRDKEKEREKRDRDRGGDVEHRDKEKEKDKEDTKETAKIEIKDEK